MSEVIPCFSFSQQRGAGMTVAQHLRGLALSHPPLLVFSGCLVAFGVTMIVLAYIIGGTELPNPDIDMASAFALSTWSLGFC
ncbi:hypothetical protein HPB48_002794 [Haemaphysalis longicornis]|uniref:TMEM248/TMEM219 domain-containing protein n=1 Tax=Haemaphysalis longicornis TaxID=44386 RepID=A0A9J6GNP0_HAELO|nr:hypothetical protein HPB48_002794 [Haemaphysalis longicornis]